MNLGKGGVLQRQDWFRSSQLVVAQPWQLFCCYTHSCSPVTKGQYTDSSAYRSCSPVKKGHCSPVKKGHCSPVKKGQYTNSTAYRSYSPVKKGQYTDSEAHRSCSPVKKGQHTNSTAYRSCSPVKKGQYTDSEAHRSCSPVKKGQYTDFAAFCRLLTDSEATEAVAQWRRVNKQTLQPTHIALKRNVWPY